MAVVVFGLTNTIVISDYWSQFEMGTNSTPTSTRITSIIQKIAAEVNGYVVGVGGVPADITEALEPISYYWLQQTIGVGGAAAIGRAMTGADPDLAKEYQRQYEKRLKELKSNPEIALADHYDDLTTPAGSIRSHVKDISLTDSGTDATTYTPTFKMDDDL